MTDKNEHEAASGPDGAALPGGAQAHGGGHGHAPSGPPGWFDKPENNRRFLAVFYVLCAVALLAELFIHRHVELDLEGRFGFYAVYGFIGIVVLVFVSVQLRKLVMRPEDYYDR